MKRFALALDLVDDPQRIAEYEAYHNNVWPEILLSIKESGITNMEIYRTGNRLFMIIECEDSFSLEKKSAKDSLNPHVQKWEALMWNYQQAIPSSAPGEKWVLMKKIFSL